MRKIYLDSEINSAISLTETAANMKTWNKILAVLIFQSCFMLASCRHEILSYDRPQDAMQDETSETEISDTSRDILVVGKSII